MTREQFLAAAEELFRRNDLYGLREWQALENAADNAARLRRFCIDKRILFRGRRRLMEIIQQRLEALRS